MPEKLRSPSQVRPPAGQLALLYQCPAGPDTSYVASSIICCNVSATDTSFRVAIAKFGAADDPKQYIYWDLPIERNDTFIATVGITLRQLDEIRVSSAGGTVAFNLCGDELT